MSPLVSFFVSGESLYPGVILFLLPIVAEFVHLSSFLRWLSRVSLWIGLAFIVMASPPVSWTADVLFGVVFLTWLLFGTRRGTASQVQGALRIAVALAVVTLLILVTIGELQRRRIPVIQGQRSDHLVVLGDSISAGIGTRSRPWPGALRQMTGVEITNLSLPGATILDGISMADHLTSQDGLVLIELGGNDILSGAKSALFEKGLDDLLKKVTLPGRTVVMFELPLLPHMIRYGQIQRNLAAKYGIWLIPKRCLVHVISGQDATSDGLHLTDVGAQRMVALVTKVFSATLPIHPIASRLRPISKS